MSDSGRGAGGRLERLKAWLDSARPIWGELTVTPALLDQHLAARLPEQPDELSALHGPDLVLAAAVLLGDAQALGRFQELLDGEIREAFSRLRAPEQVLKDAAQLVRERVLVGRGEKPPALLDYSGRGSLRAWTRVTALRTALNHLEHEQRFTGGADRELADALPGTASDPELLYMRATYRKEFEQAFRAATSALTVRERNLLRQHYIDHLLPEQVGKLHGVHRTTALRWTQQAQQHLLELVHAELRQHLELSGDELESVMRFVGSKLHFTVGRYLT